MSRIISDIVSCENQIHQFFLNQRIGSLLFLEQAMGAATEMTRGIIRSLIDRFLRELPSIYGARWLLAWQNNLALC